MSKPKVPAILPIALVLASSALPEGYDGDLIDFINDLDKAYPELKPKEDDQEVDTD